MMQKLAPSILVVALCLAVMPVTRTVAGNAEQTAPKAQYKLGPQDKVSIKVYEWRPSRDEVYEWTAFKAEYTVNASGFLSLPLLGDVSAKGMSTTELAHDLGERLKDRMGLMASPDVTAEIVQFRPFYIVGAVDKPGEYPYRPGLTALEAYAIAGGHPRNALGSVRLERESISTRGEMQALELETQNLLVRMARLQAELAKATTIDWPVEIRERMDSGPLSRAVKQEQLVFDMRRESFQTQINAQEQLRAFLENEVGSLEDQLKVHEIEVQAVKTEFDMVESLYKKGLTAAPRKLALERNKAQVDGERLRLESSLMRARQEISKTNIAVVDLQAKRSSDISTEMQTTQSRLDELKSRTETSKNLLYETEQLAPQTIAAQEGAQSLQPVFKIRRQGQPFTGQRIVSQDEIIEPGDTVMVELPPREAELRAGTSVPLAPLAAPTASVNIPNERLR